MYKFPYDHSETYKFSEIYIKIHEKANKKCTILHKKIFLITWDVKPKKQSKIYTNSLKNDLHSHENMHKSCQKWIITHAKHWK